MKLVKPPCLAGMSDYPTRSTTSWRFQDSSAECSTPGHMKSPTNAYWRPPRPSSTASNPTNSTRTIVPSVFDPAVAHALATAVRKATI